jgi:hypothetical protein
MSTIDWIELMADRAVRLLALRAGRMPDFESARAEWVLSRLELEDRGERHAFSDTHAADRFAQRVLSRAAAAALRVRCHAGVPSFRRAADPLAPGDGQRVPHATAPFYDMAVAAGCGRTLWEDRAETAVEVPGDVPPGEYLALRVAGDSMEPALHAGDTILVRRGGEAAAGTMVVARLPDGDYVVKAVKRVGRFDVELASLNAVYDPFVIPRTEGCLLGTVIMRWCPHGEATGP